MGTKTSKHNPEILDGMAGMAVSNKKIIFHTLEEQSCTWFCSLSSNAEPGENVHNILSAWVFLHLEYSTLKKSVKISIRVERIDPALEYSDCMGSILAYSIC